MIAPLDVSELNQLAALGAKFYAESGLPGRFVPDVFEASWRQFYSIGMGQIFKLEVDGQIVGAIGGMVYPDPNDADLVASEMFWFVDPAARGGGIRLFSAFEDWAKQRGAKRIAMIHLQSLAPEALERLYLRKGYRKIESHYFKTL